MKRIACMLMIILLAGCASGPFDRKAENVVERTPEQVLAEPARTGDRVIWGGRIVGIVNRENRTEIEVLSLPLRAGDRPRRDADGGRRFVVYDARFLDPVNWSPGRFITVLGTVRGVESRSVGAFPLDHPILAADGIELWPEETSSSQVSFGVGMGVSF
ncbi:MAG: Slp family lipoprotein [Wenzhouxiangellaceae bacterium]|nr:Slp family lipoprotein [Wenzhouxiangellaceae bacterium]